MYWALSIFKGRLSFQQRKKIKIKKIVGSVAWVLHFFIIMVTFPTVIYFVYSTFSCFIKICIFCLQNIMQIGFLVFGLFVRGERLFLENVACLPLVDIYFSQMYIFPLCISNINCVLFFYYLFYWCAFFDRLWVVCEIYKVV